MTYISDAGNDVLNPLGEKVKQQIPNELSGKALMDVHLHGHSDPSRFDDFFFLNYEDFIDKIDCFSLLKIFSMSAVYLKFKISKLCFWS